MDLQHHLAGKQAKGLSDRLIVDFIHNIDLGKVIAGAQCADLTPTSFPCPGAHLVRPAPGMSILFSVQQIILTGHAIAQRPLRPAFQNVTDVAFRDFQEPPTPTPLGIWL